MAHIRKRTLTDGSRRYDVFYRDASRQQHVKTYRRKTDADHFAKSVDTDIARGTWIDPRLGKTPFRDVADAWIRTAGEKAKTRADYRSMLDCHVLPAFGDRPVSAITREDIELWQEAITKRAGDRPTAGDDKRLSPARSGKALWIVRAVLDKAVRDRMIASNVAVGIKRPRVQARKKEALTVDQVEAIAEAISIAPEPQPGELDTRSKRKRRSDKETRYRSYAVLIRCLAYGGLRIGEALALRRESLDTEQSRLYVDRSVSEVGGSLIYSDTKTGSSRYVPLPQTVTGELLELLEQQGPLPPDALIFQAPNGGPLRYQNFYARRWLPALDAAGVKRCGVHILRHTCASLLAAQGFNLDQVGEQLGHSSPITTAGYRHFYPEAGRERADALQHLLDLRN